MHEKKLKELLEKKQSTDKTGQDGSPSSPETENSFQFLDDEYDDLQIINTAAKQKPRCFDFTIWRRHCENHK